MKNMLKAFALLVISFGIFVVVGSVSASQADLLQPAELVTYDEDITVNGTLRTNSIFVGEEGVGGVTYFNGSIVNIGATTPVTIADDLRVDGEIWRIEKGGDNPLKVSDHIVPTLNNRNNLGEPGRQWSRTYTNELFVSQQYVNEIHFGTPTDSVGSLSGTSWSSDRIMITSLDDVLIRSYGDSVEIDSSLTNFGGRTHYDSVDGASMTCNSSRYGDFIFSNTSIDGKPANRFYGCQEGGWRSL